MSEEKPTATICPNCQQPAIRTGNDIACEHCDAVFTITKKEGAKVKQLGPIEDHDQRIKALEEILLGEEKAPEAGTQEQQGGPQEEEETEESIL